MSIHEITTTTTVNISDIAKRILDVAKVLSVTRAETIDLEDNGTSVLYFAEVMDYSGNMVSVSDDPLSLIGLVQRIGNADFLSLPPTSTEINTDATWVCVTQTWHDLP